MPTFGQYETVREISRGAVNTVYTARRVGESGPERYAIKVCRPPTLIEPEEARHRISLFLEQVEAQRTVAATPGAHWAPIHESGELDDGAFSVSELFDLHAGMLIGGVADLTEARLLAIITSVVSGLIELRDAASRPHGNIEPANVLLSGGGSSEQPHAVLINPLPAGQIDAERDTQADMVAVGRLLYALVCHREYPGASVWPVEPGESWQWLGGRAEQWCGLCNALLAPEAGGEVMTLGDLLDRLREIGELLEKQRKRPVWPWIVAAVLGLAIAGGVVYRIWFPPPEPPTPTEAVAALRNVWGEIGRGSSWLFEMRDEVWREEGDYHNFMSTPGFVAVLESTRDAYYTATDALEDEDVDDRDLKKWWDAVSGFVPATGEISEEVILEIPVDTLDEIQANAPVVVQASNALDKIRRDFAGWPTLTDLATHAAEYRNRGLLGSATFLEQLACDANPVKENDWLKAWQTIAGINAARIFVESGDWMKFDEQFDALEEALERLSDAEVTIPPERRRDLIAIAETAQATGIENLTAIREHSEALAGRMATLTDELRTLGVWRDQVPEMDEEGERTAVNEDIRHLVDSVQGLEGVVPGADPARVDQVLEAFETSVGKLAARIDNGISDPRELLSGMLQRADTARFLDLRKMRGEYLNKALRDAYRDKVYTLTAHLRKEIPEIPKPEPATERARLNRELKRIAREEITPREERLKELDTSWIEHADFPPGRWRQELVEIADKKRRVFLSEVLQAIMSRADYPPLEGDQTFMTVWGRYEGWVEDATRSATDLGRVQDALERGYALNEPVPDDDDGVLLVGGLYDDATSSAAFKDVSNVFASLEQRVVLLRSIAGEADLGQLLNHLADRRPDVVLAAWHRLIDGVAPWPRDRELLSAAQTGRDAADGIIDGTVKALDEGRAGALRDALEAQAREFWLGYASDIRRSKDADEFEYTAGLRGDFGVDSVDPLSRPELWVDLRLHDLKPDIEKCRDDEERVSDEIRQFMAEVADLEALDGRDGVEELLRLLGDALEGGLDGAEVGPANQALAPVKRWVFDENAIEDECVLFYDWQGPSGTNHRLAFRLLECGRTDEEGGTFLCTDEVSIGLFIDLVEAANAWEVDQDFASAMSDGTGKGPRAWTLGGTQISLVEDGTWIEGADENYYENLDTGAVANRDDGFPDLSHPMNHVPPAVALFVARSINCDLPTAAEWTAAATAVCPMFSDAGGGLPQATTQSSPQEWARQWSDAVGDSAIDAGLPNLRDGTWAIQHGNIVKRMGPEVQRDPQYDARFPWPDEGMFWGRVPMAEGLSAWPGFTWSDGFLWFRVARHGVDGRIRNLVGNVAEYVQKDEPLSLPPTPSVKDTENKLKRPDGMRGMEAREWSPVAVIGGSAQSDCVAMPVCQTQVIRSTELGYADVGFRLAFRVDEVVSGPCAKLRRFFREPYLFALGGEATDRRR